MTRVYDAPQADGGTRLLILGAAAYPHAGTAKLRVPRLAPISSAASSALQFATQAISQWQNKFPKPLASVDLLVDTPKAPGGAAFTGLDGVTYTLDPPTMSKIKAARKEWMDGASAKDVLLFYCCGHGIWLPATGRTFLSASFGEDDENPWADTVALDDFAFALGEYAPRLQWLIFDCCNNTPTEALKAVNARAVSLLTSVEGERKKKEKAYGLLAQVTVASSSPGALSFGKEGRASRFMEAFLEACAGAGCRRAEAGKWWVDQQGLEEAIATYRWRVAVIEEEDYFTFPRVTQTDAAEIPRLLALEAKPPCVLLVRSMPPHRLKGANLSIRRAGLPIGGQLAGAQALARYKIPVTPWLDYDLTADFNNGPPLVRTTFAIPPLADELFEVT